jgi:energy-coupling factor transporter ATP-binding protein EcfA2
LRLILEDTEIRRADFSLLASGTFSEGIHLVWGPVGCGKTTLALLLAALLPPHRGEVRTEEIRQTKLLMQFAEYQVTCATLAEEVESWGVPSEPVLKEADLAGRGAADPLSLSRGELKRLLLLTLLRTGPDLLLLDEPFGGMDCRERRKMIGKLAAPSRRITILFTHDHGILPPIDHLWEIEGGRLLDRGGMPQALQSWSCPPPYLRSVLERGIISPPFSPEGSGRTG